VTLCDPDPEALRRTRDSIYPGRYGAFDAAIRLAAPDAVAGERFDVVVVGTPPDVHVPLALRELGAPEPPRALLIEKPLCPPDLAGCRALAEAAARSGVFVGVGYNHSLTAHTVLAERWLAREPLGRVLTLRAAFREHWGGIFRAHPWLAGPADTYLGFTERGGGALGEHSHAIHAFQHFARRLGCGRIVEVSAMLDLVDEGGARYDRVAQLHVRTESGLVGAIAQDVVTQPARKWLRVQGSEGWLEWEVNAGPGHDAVRIGRPGGVEREERVPKTRADDFLPEVAHLAAILDGSVRESPIALERGIETMLVVAAAVRSAEQGRVVRIDHAKGAGPEALS
jgi:predicted dehydrogenase